MIFYSRKLGEQIRSLLNARGALNVRTAFDATATRQIFNDRRNTGGWCGEQRAPRRRRVGPIKTTNAFGRARARVLTVVFLCHVGEYIIERVLSADRITYACNRIRAQIYFTTCAVHVYNNNNNNTHYACTANTAYVPVNRPLGILSRK